MKLLKVLLLMVGTLSILFLFSGCTKFDYFEDIYVAADLNEYGQGTYKSDSFPKEIDSLRVFVFLKKVYDGDQVKLEMKKVGTDYPIIKTSLRTDKLHVTYAIPLEGPFSSGKYEVKATYSDSVTKTYIEIKENISWPPLNEFEFNQTIITGDANYTIFSDRQDTAFRKNIIGVQSMTLEIPAYSHWFRAKWLYVNPNTSDVIVGPYTEMAEGNVYSYKGRDNKELITIEQDFNANTWFPGKYVLEIYQEIYNIPVYRIHVELIDEGQAAKAPTDDISPTDTPTEIPTETPTDTPTETEVSASTADTATEQALKEIKVYMTSGEDTTEVLTQIPYGLKTPLYAVAVTDYPEGTTLSYGLRLVNGDVVIANSAEVVIGPVMEDMYYTHTSFELYKPDEDNWPPGLYKIELYKEGEIVTQSGFEIIAP